MNEREARALIDVVAHIRAEEFDKADDLIFAIESGELEKARSHNYFPANGDVVFMRWDTRLRGKIHVAGAEQSEVKFESGAVQCFPNFQIVLGRPREGRMK